MQKIIYAQAAVDRLQELLEVLYQEGYVGFEDSAEDYVRDIFSFIATPPQQRHKNTKNPRCGKWHCSYQRNRRTTWFICFDVDYKEEVYLVKNITNNHTPDYPQLIL